MLYISIVYYRQALIRQLGMACRRQAYPRLAFAHNHFLRIKQRLLAGGFAGANGGDVGGKFRLLEGAFEDVGVRDSDFSPRFHELVDS